MLTHGDPYADVDQDHIENNLAASVGFRYPNDESVDERYFDVSAMDILIRFSTLLFSSPKPKVVMAALLFSCGVDVGIYLGCENTESAIAKVLGESKQNLSATLKRVRIEFGIKHTNTGKASKDQYKTTNYRKKSYEKEEPE